MRKAFLCAAALGLTALLWALAGIVGTLRPEPSTAPDPDHPFRRLLALTHSHVQSIWVVLGVALTALLGLKAAVAHHDHLWAAGAIGGASIAGAVMAVWRRREHWAFAALRRQAPPAVKDPAWPRNAIDPFVLRRLEAQGLRPSPEADRPTLIRRLYLDLLGLPPAVT